jgi:carboxyl-terminal processing protease
MKKLVMAVLLFTTALHAQQSGRACTTFSRLNEIMQERHYQPKTLDDSLSAHIYATVMEQLDENHTLFLQEEADALAKHRYQIDDYIKNGNCAFFADFVAAYKKALERRKTFIDEIAAAEMPHNAGDTMYYSKSVYPYHKEGARIKTYLRKRLTFDILEDIARMGTNRDSLMQQVDNLFPASKTKVIDGQLCILNTLLEPAEGFENAMYNKFYSAFCSYFDPHSTYFNYNEKASFVSTISTSNLSLGLYISRDSSEEVVVDEVVPGGPAYETKKITKGDKIIKLEANNTEYAVSCSSMETIGNIIYSDTYKNVNLTLRKNDGTVYSVALKKKVMKADDHSVYSYVLDEGGAKTGYIKIPSFYTAFDGGAQGTGCAEDVAKELNKLKKAGIAGLIIDLQYNGGGSMDEVIRLSGMFINFGPLSVLTDRSRAYNTVRDYNRGMLYDGPMVVLVNGYTASASEFFAGVMQDYNRAVIVGSATLGKATMQTILPLDQDETDFVKVTIDKFYRVTGKSSQYRGIIPDIELPFVLNDLLTREKDLPRAIKNDSIDVKLRYVKMPDAALKQAVTQSMGRLGSNPVLTSIKNMNTQVGEIYAKDKEPLAINFETVFREVHAMDKLWKDITGTLEAENNIAVTDTVAQNTKKQDRFYQTINDAKVKTIRQDPYIFESLKVLKDINSYKSN